MVEFFRGWRPKLGCATLMMACLFMGAWIRGHAVCDVVTYGYQGGYQELNLSHYGIKWFRSEGDTSISWGNEVQFHHSPNKSASGVEAANGAHPAEFHLGDETQSTILSHRKWSGFHFAKVIWLRDEMRMTMLVVPYWSIVIPLTLLSVWLLLVKRRALNSVSNSMQQ